jgi:microcompartment protein CcmL/EutN
MTLHRGLTAGVDGPDPGPMAPALALLELASIAVGIEAGDAMVKRAPVEVVHAGTVHPGKYLVLVAGAVADVEEALAAGLEVGEGCLVDTVLLPNVHDQVVAALRGTRRAGLGDALGIVETATVAATIEAADAGLKGARVRLLELHLADGLGGKGYLLFDGSVADVEAAVAIAVERISDPLASSGAVPGSRTPIARVIPQLHREMRAELEASPRFGVRVAAAGSSGGVVGTAAGGEA